MLESLELVAIIAVLAVILFWYLQNLRADTQGTCGLLALRDDPASADPAARRQSYRMKSRGARSEEMGPTQAITGASENSPPIEPALAKAAHMRRKFRRQDEARYRVKDKKPDIKSE